MKYFVCMVVMINNCFHYIDVQLCPILSDDYIPKLFYETNRFHAFDQMWVIKAKVIGNETSYNRALSYQLILKGCYF